MITKKEIAEYIILHGGYCVNVKSIIDNSDGQGEPVDEVFRDYISTNSETFIAKIYSRKNNQ